MGSHSHFLHITQELKLLLSLAAMAKTPFCLTSERKIVMRVFEPTTPRSKMSILYQWTATIANSLPQCFMIVNYNVSVVLTGKSPIGNAAGAIIEHLL